MKLARRFSAPLLFLLLAVFSLILCVYKPFRNWDMIGYIAAAKSFEQRDIETLHAFTYEQVRNSVSSAEYEELAREKGSGYGNAISTDPTAFKEQLPFYQIRPVYTGLIYLLYKTGVDIALATYLIPGLAVVMAIPFLYFMSVSYLAKPFTYALPMLAIVYGVLDLARYSTPDGLAFLAVIVSAYLYLKARFAMLLALLPILVGIRTDLILFTIPLSLFLFAFDKGNRRKAALSAFISVVLYFGVGAYWGNPGWSTIFHFTLVQKLTHPISMPPTLTAQEYFSALFDGTRSLVANQSFVLYVMLAAYSLYLIWSHAKRTSVKVALRSPPAVLTFVCLFFLVSHFLAFPVIWDRFFTAPYLIGAFSLLVMMTNYLRESKSVQQGLLADGDSVAPPRK